MNRSNQYMRRIPLLNWFGLDVNRSPKLSLLFLLSFHIETAVTVIHSVSVDACPGHSEVDNVFKS